MKVQVVSIDHGWNELRRMMREAGGGDSFAKAGIVGAKASAQHEGGDEQEPVNNATLAMIHEFGLGVPERSFIRAAFDANREKYLANLQTLVSAIYDGKLTVGRALTLLGMQCASDIRKLIIDGAGVPPPNAPATIKRKGSSRPLVDSAQMKNSITHEVVLNGSSSKEP